jgi:hypothetical protein
MTAFEKQQRETEEMIRKWYDAETSDAKMPSSEGWIMAIFNGKNTTQQGEAKC